jgi:HEPN domain-containing protein
MRREDPRAHLARGWFARAQRDLASSERLLLQPAFPAEVVFHCQQAAEKALKGFLVWHNQPFRKTHDLIELGG